MLMIHVSIVPWEVGIMIITVYLTSLTSAFSMLPTCIGQSVTDVGFKNSQNYIYHVL